MHRQAHAISGQESANSKFTNRGFLFQSFHTKRMLGYLYSVNNTWNRWGTSACFRNFNVCTGGFHTQHCKGGPFTHQRGNNSKLTEHTQQWNVVLSSWTTIWRNTVLTKCKIEGQVEGYSIRKRKRAMHRRNISNTNYTCTDGYKQLLFPRWFFFGGSICWYWQCQTCPEMQRWVRSRRLPTWKRNFNSWRKELEGSQQARSKPENMVGEEEEKKKVYVTGMDEIGIAGRKVIYTTRWDWYQKQWLRSPSRKM